MPQILKEELRARILTAALEVFAAQGYLGATMTMIAERAGLGAASLYRYYPGKSDLFDAVIPAELAERFAALLDRRVRALGKVILADAPGADAESDAIFRFWVEHRLAVVVLLDRAAGTAYAQYGERFVTYLVTGTIAQISAARPGTRVRAPARFVLERIFESTRRTLAAILEQHADERALREALDAFWSYQIPGLRGYAEAVSGRRGRKA